MWLLSSIGLGLLTVGRAMATQQVYFDGDVWFSTKEHSAKVDEVNREQHVNITYANPDDQRYLSVSGTARLVRDQQKARELWYPIYKAWFPDGLDDPELALLRVSVHKAEYWILHQVQSSSWSVSSKLMQLESLTSVKEISRSSSEFDEQAGCPHNKTIIKDLRYARARSK